MFQKKPFQRCLGFVMQKVCHFRLAIVSFYQIKPCKQDVFLLETSTSAAIHKIACGGCAKVFMLPKRETHCGGALKRGGALRRPCIRQ
jgi:hypothetical protein